MTFPPSQVDIFMALAKMASYKAASTCRVAKCAADDTLLLSGHRGSVIDLVMWKKMYKGIEIYKGRVFAYKAAVLLSQA